MGVLRARVNGEWEDVVMIAPGAGGSTDEVAIGPDDPGGEIELWFDTDDTPETVDGLLPPGGSAGQVLAKNTATNYDTSWVPRTSGGNPNGGSVVARYYSTTDVVSGDIDTINAIASLYDVPLQAGHLYEISSRVCMRHMGTGVAGGGFTLLRTDHPVDPTDLAVSDTYIHAGSVDIVNFNVAHLVPDVSRLWLIRLMIGRSWWSTPNIRYVVNAAQPAMLTVTDLGPPPT